MSAVTPRSSRCRARGRGTCGADGFYGNFSGEFPPFVVSEQNGKWGISEEVPGIAALNKGVGAQIGSLSCGTAGRCGDGGSYQDAASHAQAYVVSET